MQKIIWRGFVVNVLLLWLVACWGVAVASDERIRRLDPADIARLAPVARGLALLLPLPFALAVRHLRRLSPASRANRSPLGAAFRRGAKALGWAYVALLVFSLFACAARLRASATWMRGNTLYTVGIRPGIALPGASSGCPGTTQYHFLCFFCNTCPRWGCL